MIAENLPGTHIHDRRHTERFSQFIISPSRTPPPLLGSRAGSCRLRCDLLPPKSLAPKPQHCSARGTSNAQIPIVLSPLPLRLRQGLPLACCHPSPDCSLLLLLLHSHHTTSNFTSCGSLAHRCPERLPCHVGPALDWTASPSLSTCLPPPLPTDPPFTLASTFNGHRRMYQRDRDPNCIIHVATHLGLDLATLLPSPTHTQMHYCRFSTIKMFGNAKESHQSCRG